MMLILDGSNATIVTRGQNEQVNRAAHGSAVSEGHGDLLNPR